jgi:hypothetical protein
VEKTCACRSDNAEARAIASAHERQQSALSADKERCCELNEPETKVPVAEERKGLQIVPSSMT